MENWDPHGIEGPNEKGFYGRRCHKWNRRAFMQWGLLWIKGALMGKRAPIDKNALIGKRPLQEKGALMGREDFHEKKDLNRESLYKGGPLGKRGPDGLH